MLDVRQCRETQDLYLKVREEVGTECTDIKDLYLKVRGEVGDSVHTLLTSIEGSEWRLETV